MNKKAKEPLKNWIVEKKSLLLMGKTACFILFLFLNINLAHAAVQIDEELRPEFAPQGYSEIYNEGDPDKYFSDASINYIVADIAVVLLQMAGVLAIYFIVTNGFNLVKSFGREEEIQQAKKGLTWAILGLLVVLMSYGIVQNLFKLTLNIDSAPKTNETTQNSGGT